MSESKPIGADIPEDVMKVARKAIEENEVEDRKDDAEAPVSVHANRR